MANYKDDAFRRNDDISIKQAVEKMLDVYHLRRKFDETSILSAWPNIIGKAIANRTQQIYIKDKKLFVKVESAVIKNELMLMRKQIMVNVNEYVGKVVVEDLIIL
ncbi:DciA family protein [Sphingobacterium hungaricum]